MTVVAAAGSATSTLSWVQSHKIDSSCLEPETNAPALYIMDRKLGTMGF